MTYIALIRAGAVRDTQCAKCEFTKAEHTDDEAWFDMPDAEIFVAVYRDVSEQIARQKAAYYAGTDEANIRLISLES